VRILLTVLFVFLSAPQVLAQPVLLGSEARLFPQHIPPPIERTVPLNRAGSELVVRYSSDKSFDLHISFPVKTGDDSFTFNPMHRLVVRDLLSSDDTTIAIDLRQSPAWSPGRNEYLLHIFGEDNTTLTLHETYIRRPSLFGIVGGFFTQLMIDEPVLISSVNFLWGYRVGDVSVGLLLGILFFMFLIVDQWINGSMARQMNRSFRVILVCLFFLLLYDARFSLDLLRVTAADGSEWREDRRYRQLGPLRTIESLLKQDGAEKVGMCFDGADLLLKQLRYRMYPVLVQRIEEMTDATHLVIMDSDRGLFGGGIVSCGKYSSDAELIRSFSDGSFVLRLQ
jgi:hypothetical protein